MTCREMMQSKCENLSWCKPLSFADGKVIATVNEGAITGLQIDGQNVPVNNANIRAAAKLVNECYDLYQGWSDTHILLEAECEELPCHRCPWFDVCDAMDENAD